MAERVDYQQFVHQLRQLVEHRATTKAVLVTDDHHSLWVGVTEGVITTLIYGPKRGNSALPFVRQIVGGNFALREETELPATPDLPSTSAILDELASAIVIQPSQAAAAPRATLAPSESPASEGARIPTDQVLADLQRVVNGYLGPIASMILNNAVRAAGGMQTEAQFQQVVASLASEVDGIGDVRKFRSDALAVLKKR